MALQVSYKTEVTGDLNLLEAELGADLAKTANGGFTAAYQTDSGILAAQSFDRIVAPTSLPYEVNSVGAIGAVAGLANGNSVTAFQELSQIFFRIHDRFGNVVRAPVKIEDADSSNADVAALSQGGFVIVNQDRDTRPDDDIEVHVRTATGNAVADFTVDGTTAIDSNAAVVGLTSGGFAVTWQRNTASETEIWMAVYNDNGTLRRAPTLVDTAGTINKEADIVALNNGGFAIVYADNEGGNWDIALARFNSSGQFLGRTQVTSTSGDDFRPAATLLSNGVIAISYDRVELAADPDTFVAFVDPESGSVINAGSGGGRLAANIVDENDTSIVGLDDGKFVVTWSNEEEGVVGEIRQTIRNVFDTSGDDNDFTGDELVDKVQANSGNDRIDGNVNNDVLAGGLGNDTLIGGEGADELNGAAGNDSYFVDNGGDVIIEQVDGGFDTVNTDLNAYTLGANLERLNFIGEGNFVGAGNGLDNRFAGGLGNDRFVHSAGGDIYGGGTGVDTVDFRASASGATINFKTSVFSGAAAGDTFSSIEKFLGSNAAADQLTGTGNGRFNFAGFDGNDLLVGANNIDVLQGGDGADTLIGGAGIDTLSGDAGQDRLTGGSGGDFFRFTDPDFGQDIVTDFQDGLDRLKVHSAVADAFADFTIAGNGTSNVVVSLAADPAETITLTGATAITISAADFLFF